MNRKDSGLSLKHRQVAFKTDTVSDDGTFKGYASVFGNVDSYGEIVEAGAFSESLKSMRKNDGPLPVLWQHDSTQPIGGDELVSEDETGLKADGFLLIDTIPMAKQAHALLKRRVVKGLSIGYYVEKDSYNEKTGVRTLHKLALKEYSIVTFPANTLANVESVKHAVRDGHLPTLSEFESFLCEAGFSRTQAKAVAGYGLRKLLDRCEADGKASEALQMLKDFRIPSL